MISKVISNFSFKSLKLVRSFAQRKCFAQNCVPPARVAVTGAAGQVGYSVIFRIAKYIIIIILFFSGELLGPDQPIILQLIDQPGMEGALNGVKMELEDCSFPVLDSIDVSTKYSEGFKGTNYAFLIGARPRGPGMQRKDLLKLNAEIFANCGKAINQSANKNIKVLVVGNPCNTNCLICSANAPKIPKTNFTALTKLDHNRAKYQVNKNKNILAWFKSRLSNLKYLPDMHMGKSLNDNVS